jgi:hypothetical protein
MKAIKSISKACQVKEDRKAADMEKITPEDLAIYAEIERVHAKQFSEVEPAAPQRP